MTGPGDGDAGGRGGTGGEGEVDPPTEPNPSVDPPTEPNPSVDPPTQQIPPADPSTQQIPPADPPTENLPPVEGDGGGTAWSQYPAGPPAATPTGGYPTGDIPPEAVTPPPGDVPPPPDGGDFRDGDGGDGSPTPWMIVALLLAVVLVAGLIVWLVNATGNDRDPVATPTTTTQTTTSTPRTTPSPTTPTTTGPPGVAERCSPEFVAEELGDGTTVRECDGRFLLVRGEDGDLELLSWREDTWEFLAEPSAEVCREQLEELGVPDRFRRVFQPCDAPTPSPTTPTTTAASPTPPTTPTTATTSPAPPVDPGAGGVEEGAAADDPAAVGEGEDGDRADGTTEDS